MAIQTARGVHSALRSGRAFLQVRGGDYATVWEVVCRVNDELEAYVDPAPGNKQSSAKRPIQRQGDVVELPDGPGWELVLWHGSDARHLGAAELLARRLEEAGVTDATIAVPEHANSIRGFIRYEGLAVVAHAFAPRPENRDRLTRRVLPEGWVDAALAWTSREPRISLFGPSLPDVWIPSDAVVGAARRLHRQSFLVELAAPTTRVSLHTTALSSGLHTPFFGELTSAGPDPRDVARHVLRLSEMLLALDPRPVYASIKFLYGGPHVDDTHRLKSDRDTNLYSFEDATDRLAPGAYGWQLLSEGHRDTLGGWPQGAQVFDNDRHAVVAFGLPEDWADPTRASYFQAQAREVLAPILAAKDPHWDDTDAGGTGPFG